MPDSSENPQNATDDSNSPKDKKVASEESAISSRIDSLLTKIEEVFPSKWGILQGLIAALSILFAVNFGYAIFKSIELKDSVESLENARSNFNNLRFQFMLHTELNNSFNLSRVHLDRGVWFHHREQWRQAISSFEKGELELKNCQKIIDRLQGHQSNLSYFATDTSLNFLGGSIESSKIAVDFALADTYYYHAIAEFHSASELWEPENTGPFAMHILIVKQLGESIQSIDPDRYEGYHLQGLYGLEAGDYGEHTFNHLRKSISLESGLNRDMINLSELAFVNGRYDLCIENAENYLESDPTPTKIRKTILEFFILSSEYLKPGSRMESQEYLRQIDELIDESGLSASEISGIYSIVPLRRLYYDIKNENEKNIHFIAAEKRPVFVTAIERFIPANN